MTQRRKWFWNDPLGSGKRALDLVLCGIVLAFLWPFYLLIALWITLDDGGPIFYIQERIGKDGKPFPFFKFRTMIVNAEKQGAGFDVTSDDDRITRAGRFLRRWSLDEIPQVLNVLRGEMSLIGPRPTLAYQVAEYTDFQRRRLEVLPGITGWAQVNGRNSLTWPQRIELDVEYIDRYSLALDVQILLRTFGAVVNESGIYGHGWVKKK